MVAITGVSGTGTAASFGGTFSRASNATYLDINGNLAEVGNDYLRPLYVGGVFSGALIEPASTNGTRNPRGEGAVVGSTTLPTNWSVTNSAAGSLTFTVVGQGRENGIPYTDIRVTGTNANTACRFVFEAIGVATASTGQTWSASFYVKLVGGTLTNINAINSEIQVYDAGSTGLTPTGGYFTSIVPSSASLVSQRVKHTWTVAVASGTPASVRLACTYALPASGIAMDCTLRIGAPQIEQSPATTSAILPPIGSPAMYTRATETISAGMPWTAETLTGVASTGQIGTLLGARNSVTLTLSGVSATGQPQNAIVNSTMQGAVAGTPGTFPTGWNANFAGTTSTVVGTGVENGIPYIDVRCNGTTTGTLLTFIYQTPGIIPQIIAATGETWTFTVYHRLVAGSWTNMPAANLELRELLGVGSSSTVQADLSPGFVPTGASLDSQRTNFTVTLSGGPTVGSLRPATLFSITSGVAVDFTLRIGLPMLYKQITAPTGTVATQLTGVQSTGQAGTLTKSAVEQLTGVQASGQIVPSNAILNPTMQGAIAGTPGTPPTYWALVNALAGLSSTIVGTGTENGIPYIEWRIFGTTTALNGPVVYQSLTPTPIAALTGQTWTQQVYFRLIAGDFTNVTAIHHQVNEFFGATQVRANLGPDFFPTNASLDSQRYDYTATFSGGPTVNAVRPGTQIVFPAVGVAVDFTIRIGLPMLYSALTASAISQLTGVQGSGQTTAPSKSLTTLLTGVSATGQTTAPSKSLTTLLIGVSATGQTERQNAILNPTMQGVVPGTPGTMPTYWTRNVAGLSTAIVGTGVENGIPYIDIQMFGTTTGPTGSFIYQTVAGAPLIPAQTGQTWTEKVYLRLVAGDFTNVTSLSHQANEYNASPALVLPNSGPTFLPSGAALDSQPYSYTVTLSGGPTVAAVRPATQFTIPVGVPVDFTLRIGYPVLYREPASTPTITTQLTGVSATGQTIAPTNSNTTSLTGVSATGLAGRQNTILNPTMQGAVVGIPGTLPTYWNVQNIASNIAVVATGSETGIPYIDIRVSGTTPTSVAYFVYQATIANVPILATTGQTWTQTVYMRLIAGDYTNIPNFHHSIRELLGTTGTFVLDNLGPDFFPTNAPLNTQRYDYTVTLSGGATIGSVRPATHMVFSGIGVPIDFTMRIGFPALYQEYVAPTPSVLTPPLGVAAQGVTGSELRTYMVSASRAGLGSIAAIDTSGNRSAMVSDVGTVFDPVRSLIANSIVQLNGVQGQGQIAAPSPAVAGVLTGITGTGSAGTATAIVAVAISGAVGTGTAGSLSDEVDQAPNGVAATGSATTLIPQISIVAPNVSATGSATTLIPQITTGISGVAATGSTTTVTASIAVSIAGTFGTGSSSDLSDTAATAPNGVSAAASAQSLHVEIDVILIGASGTGTAASIIGEPIGVVSGVETTAAAGTFALEIDVILNGASGTGSVGRITTQSGLISGVEGMGDAGHVTTETDTSIAITGMTGVGTANDVTSAVTITASGVQAVGQMSVLLPTVTTALSGVGGSGTAGTVIPAIASTLIGVTGTGVVGTAIAQADILAGVAGVGTPGILTPEISITLTGVIGTGAVATPITQADILTGVAGTGSAASLTPASGIPMTGIAATGQTGIVIAGTATVAPLVGVAGVGSASTLMTKTDLVLTGAETIGQIGILVPQTTIITTQVPLVGVLGSGAIGTIVTDILVELGAAVATGEVGDLLGALGILNGVGGDGSAGDIAMLHSVVLAGVGGTGGVGRLKVSGGRKKEAGGRGVPRTTALSKREREDEETAAQQIRRWLDDIEKQYDEPEPPVEPEPDEPRPEPSEEVVAEVQEPVAQQVESMIEQFRRIAEAEDLMLLGLDYTDDGIFEIL